MAKTVEVNVRDLKIFRCLLEREAKTTWDSYRGCGETDRRLLDPSAPHFVIIEYRQMLRAIELIDRYIAGGSK